MIAAERGLATTPVLVTGGSRGIGRAIALRLARRGHPVAINYQRDEFAARAVASEIEADGGAALAVRADVRNAEEVAAMFAATREAFGDVSVLVNNAGVHRGGRVERLGLEDWRAVLDTNLTGAFLCCREAVPAMRKRGSGRIVNVGSVIGRRGFPGDVAYGSAKAGLLGLTRALAIELARDGVTVNLVAPGFVKTDMTAGLTEDVRARIEGSVPVGRRASVEEVAEVIEAAVFGPDYVTGAEFTVDGGYTIR